MKLILFVLTLSFTLFHTAQAQNQNSGIVHPESAFNVEEFNSFSDGNSDFVDQISQSLDTATGHATNLDEIHAAVTTRIAPMGAITAKPTTTDCYQMSCKLFAHVVKGKQRLFLYVDGVLFATWKVSTGISGWGTPNFDTHPSGKIRKAYDSQTYPGGYDYEGLGNMPYSVFVKGPYAIHGTPEWDWDDLGHRASHGCIRLHPNNALIFMNMVKEATAANSWITVSER